MIKLALVDDVEADLSKAEAYIKNYVETNHAEVANSLEVSKFQSPLLFVQHFERGRFDLIVLDIFMKELDGLKVAQFIRTKDRDCSIIFLTSSDAFILEGYLVFASGYFIKPLEGNAEAFQKTFEFIYPKLLEKNRMLRLPIAKGIEIDVPYDNILFVDINEKHKLRMTTRAKEFISTMTYEDCARVLLTDKRFLECHYRIIVNMDHIEQMLDEDFLLADGRKVPISYRKRKQSKLQYMQYLVHKGD